MDLTKEWFIYTKRADFRQIAEKFGINPVTARVLRNRDIVTEEEIRLFLYGNLKDLYDPALLPDAEKAAGIISEKVRSGKKIRIIGDYDIDGVCATYILFDSLRKAGADVSYVIPERVRDGYGINMRIVTEAIADGIDTLITCDNGIAAFDELKKAKEAGLTVILTDHHDIRTEGGKERLPEADCIVNAKRKDSRYPEREICGAVTAWKMIRPVFETLGLPEDGWESYLEFAGIATIGDVMNLRGENRIIAKEALNRLNRGPVNAGLKALMEETGLSGKHIGCYHIGFVIGPCINAGGRLETAEKAIRTFLAESREEAFLYASELKKLNDTRKDMTQAGVEKARKEAEETGWADRILVICLKDLHESMAGIVAGKIKEEYNRPCFILTEAEGMPGVLKGSGRSIESWNMFEELEKAGDLLLRYGGHPMAAGITLSEDRLEEFRTRLNENCRLGKEDFVKKIWIDMQLPFSCITKDLVRELEGLEPFGPGNPRPLFAEKNIRAANLRVLGKNRNALKADLISADGRSVTGMMFGDADALKKELSEKETVTVTYHPQINEYMGAESLQLQIEDYR